MNGLIVLTSTLGACTLLFGILATWGWALASFRKRDYLQEHKESLRQIGKLDELHKTVEDMRERGEKLRIQLKVQEEQLKNAKDIKEQMTADFSRISQEILEKQGAQLQKTSEDKLLGITRPLGESLSGFQKQIVEYEKNHLENRGRFQQVISDLQQNTKTLAEAFKKDQKFRGTWGEQQLTLILEQSGLIEGRDFYTQVSVEGSEQNRQQIDALLVLPENRHLVIDVKTPFVNYERILNASSDDERESFKEAFFNDVKAQIKDLATKDYTKSRKGEKSLQSPPVTFMFLPIESAFSLVMENMGMQEFARKSNIMLCSPQTLFALSKTVAFIWQLYHQDKNSAKILETSKKIVSKVDTICKNLSELEEKIFGKSMSEAFEKLKAPLTGRGGLSSLGRRIRNFEIENSSKEDVFLESDILSSQKLSPVSNYIAPLKENNTELFQNLEDIDSGIVEE